MALGIGVSEATIKRWCDQGKLETLRTEGGHRRIPMHAVLSFLKKGGHKLINPEVLNLPLHTGKSDASLRRVTEDMVKALSEGNLPGFRRLVYNLVLANRTLVEICDNAIAPAFIEIGERWHENELGIYQERRACQICAQVIFDLQQTLPPTKPNAPLAIGGTFSSDQYELATLMVELCLMEAGWNAKNLGCNLPPETYLKAIKDLKPNLIWFSVNHPKSEESFLNDYRHIYDQTKDSGVPIAVGGQALRRELRSQMQYGIFCDQIHHLIDFTKRIKFKDREHID